MATISFKSRHFQHDMILQSVRRYLAGNINLIRIGINPRVEPRT